MRVLQTLGRDVQQDPGVFQYRHGADEVIIDPSINANRKDRNRVIRLSAQHWHDIVAAVQTAGRHLRITEPSRGGDGQCLRALIRGAVQKPLEGELDDSACAYVVAVLYHEGCLQLCYGDTGPIWFESAAYHGPVET